MRRWLVFTPLLLLALPACDNSGAFASDAGPTPPPGADGGPASRGDASLPPLGPDGGAAADAGAAIDAGTMESDAEYDRGSSLDAAAARAACFDGDDNDSDGLFDCADTSCQLNVPSCCVGQSSATCCAAGAEQVLAVAACDGLLADCAVPGVPFEAFGTPAPTVRTFAGDMGPTLVPGGQDTDGGAVLTRVLDPRAGTIRLSVTIASPLDAPASGRVETVGVGFVDETVSVSAGLSRVAPVAGVVVSRNRSEVLLVIAGDVVQRFALTSAAPVTYTLELDPTGRVRLSSPGAITADVAYPLGAPVRAIVYGRTANPTAATAPARVLDLRVTPSACDMPAALGRSGVVVPAPGDDDTWSRPLVSIGEPSVLRYEQPPGTEQRRMALNVDGALYLATPGAGGYVLTTPIGEPVLMPPTVPWAADGVSDPALIRVGDETELLFTGWSDGLGTIGRALWDAGTERFVLEGPLPGLEASGGTGFSSIAPFDIEGVPHAIVRVDDATGHRLSVYRLGGAEPVVAALRAPRPTDVFAFDRDEVDGPAVLFRGSVYRAYFAGRRGTRWSLGLLVSDDGLEWHEPSPGQTVLSPSGAGFDALGVRDPSFDIIAGQLHVYYAGDDGERVRIGVAIAR